MNKEVLKSVYSSITKIGLQPVLTIVLIILLVIFGAQILQNQNYNNTHQKTIQLESKFTFDQAYKNYKDSSFEVLTFGALLTSEPLNKPDDTSVSPITSTKTATITPTLVTKDFYSNPYDYNFFTVDKNYVKRIDVKSFGDNSSVIIKQNGNFVFANISKKTYVEYPLPQSEEKQALVFFESTRSIMQNLFVLKPILDDYEQGLFSPTERATNIYSGLWKHPIITSNESVDITIQLDGTNGLFKKVVIPTIVPDPNYTSIITFEFRPRDENFMKNYDSLPPGINKVDIKIPYKYKS